MTEDPNTAAPEPDASWVALSPNESTPADRRMFAAITAHVQGAAYPDPTARADGGNAVFVVLQRFFTGPLNEATLEAIADAWFQHSGLYPLLAVCDLNTGSVSFCKGLDITDEVEAIRITKEGADRALSTGIELGAVLSNAWKVEVSREQDSEIRFQGGRSDEHR